MRKLKGIGASSGVAVAKVFKLVHPDLTPSKKIIEEAQVEAELEKLKAVLQQSNAELVVIKARAFEKMGASKAAVFEAHILMLNDPEYISSIEAKIRNEKLDAPSAVHEVSQMFIGIFESLTDEYMRERAADIKDISSRILAHLLHIKIPDLTLINEKVIIVAEDLTPSDTAQLDKQFVCGFATNIGGRTSHSAIMARSLEIPAVVGLKTILADTDEFQIIALDGETGEIIIEPKQAIIDAYEQKAAAIAKDKELLKKYKDLPSITKDGHHVELAANIGTPNDLEGVLANGSDGIGLYRTEFLYMDATVAPTEDQQYTAYTKVLQSMVGKPVVIRTIDIGGDKKLPYMPLPEEENPFLGYRALRMCLGEYHELFRTQLRALLKASVHGDLRIMFPMVTTVNELIDAKKMLEEEKTKLLAQGVEISSTYQVGMMMEVPAAAIIADKLIKHADFFSIGTNDLIGYTMAADRMNEKVSYLYQPYNPSILRLVKNIIDAAHAAGKWTGMCGEMAGDLMAIPLLVGLGLDEFSMSATSVLHARRLISTLDKKEMELLAEKALDCSTMEEVEKLVEAAV
ncbi:phosphotransferase system enzyme I PtsI [Erysipelotrichaceae bacterium]|nr:phosphotransferase system enzyme I PtsI [Erysipelotrichaceae bacterium]